jgi:tetratricopeptide (TPR) repeat protein
MAALALAILFAVNTVVSQQKGQSPSTAPPADDPVMLLVGRGSQYYVAQNYREAIGPYQKALDLEKQKSRLDPTMFRVLVDNLGMAYGLTGDLNHARETFEYGVSRDPSYPLFHYNLACTFAEMDDLDRALAELGLAYQYKQNMIPGEEFPDPRTDDSFQRYLKNRRFLDFLNSAEQRPAGQGDSSRSTADSLEPPAIRGTLLRAGGVPIADAEVTLQVFRDEACAKLFDLKSSSPEDASKLSKCSRDLFTVQSNEKGEYVFAGVQAGWYAVRFLWNIEPKPSSGPSADHIGGFLVVYAAQKDVSGRYDTLSQGPAFHFDAALDYVANFKY